MKQAVTDSDGAASPTILAPQALRAFFGLAKAWGLSDQEQIKLLGLTRYATLRGWRAGHVGGAGRDTVERISYLLGIFKAINILLPQQEQADAWVRSPNNAPLFGGRSALDRMMAGNVGDLLVVRQYLDGELG